MYRYETHLHTFPVSKCSRASVEESVAFYAKEGYDGIFITNHFIDGNINCDKVLDFNKKLDFYFTDYEEGAKLSKKYNIKVFCGVEISYGGTDFLIYGATKEWFKKHLNYINLGIVDKLKLFKENGFLIIQAHPFREASYISFIRLLPRYVEGVEVDNSCNTDFENNLANSYADAYNLIKFAGTDNHCASNNKKYSGIETKNPINSVDDFINVIRKGEFKIFSFDK